MKKSFQEFLKVDWNSPTGDKPSISGFAIDVFHAVLDALPFLLPYEFIPSNGTYDEILYQIKTHVGFFLFFLYDFFIDYR